MQSSEFLERLSVKLAKQIQKLKVWTDDYSKGIRLRKEAHNYVILGK
jgi:hypothetical protein